MCGNLNIYVSTHSDGVMLSIRMGLPFLGFWNNLCGEEH